MADGVQLASQGFSPLLSSDGGVFAGQSFALTDLDDSPVDVFTDATLATPISTPQTAADGSFPGFQAPGTYKLTVGGVAFRVELVSGDVQAASVVDSSLDTGSPVRAPSGGLGRRLRDFVSVADFGAIGTGASDSDTQAANNAAIQAAIDAVGVGGGTVLFPPGTYYFSAPLIANNYQHGLVLQGSGKQTAGATANTTLVYTGTASPSISAHHTLGFAMRGITLRYNNAAFTGYLVEANAAGAASGADTQVMEIDHCNFVGIASLNLANAVTGLGGSASGAYSAAAALLLNQTTSVTISNCLFEKVAVGVYGCNGSYSNGVTISRSLFLYCTDCPIVNPGQTWTIDNNLFDAPVFDLTTKRVRAALVRSSMSTTWVPVITNNWCGDTTASSLSFERGTWIDFTDTTVVGGLISANYFSGTGPVVCSADTVSASPHVTIRVGPSTGAKPKVGAAVIGPNIPGGATVLGSPAPTSAGFTMSAPASASATSVVTVEEWDDCPNACVMLGRGEGMTIQGNRFEGNTSIDFSVGYFYGAAIVGNDLLTVNSVTNDGVVPADITTYPAHTIGLAFVGNHNNAGDLGQGFAGGLVVSGSLRTTGQLGFYGVTPVGRPTVTGSRGGNAALASLLTALSNLGLVTNSTSA